MVGMRFLRFIAAYKWLWIFFMWLSWQMLTDEEKADFEDKVKKNTPT
jgi:hypothetical protein